MIINFSHVNFIAVAISTVASFTFLGIWYSAYHAIGKKWLKLSGANPSKYLLYIGPVYLVATFIVCTLFAIFVADGYVFIKDSLLQDALLKSVIVSCGLIIPILTIQNMFYLFGGCRWQLIVIDGIFYIVKFALFAFILTLMR